MALYVCLLYSAGVIEYWENLECESDGAALALATTMMSEENWDIVELTVEAMVDGSSVVTRGSKKYWFTTK